MQRCSCNDKCKGGSAFVAKFKCAREHTQFQHVRCAKTGQCPECSLPITRAGPRIRMSSKQKFLNKYVAVHGDDQEWYIARVCSRKGNSLTVTYLGATYKNKCKIPVFVPQWFNKDDPTDIVVQEQRPSHSFSPYVATVPTSSVFMENVAITPSGVVSPRVWKTLLKASRL